ncbi:hypothetical protein HGP29_20005 [Flammeovirga sp. SR4]|uniref:Uncharacterized protein n=1 Tax=Flammeovirga agarivorans TaxID=2726742 RepID=A0A7X8SNM9_9BACT|nr:hypothetical protein [Flammeovirga agarivorans]
MNSSSKIQIEKSDSHLKITFKWYQPHAFFLDFFCIAWNSFLTNWYSSDGDLNSYLHPSK